MKMTREYFESHVTFAVELDYGTRYWREVTGLEALNDYCKRHAEDLSDIDYCTHQVDEHVKNFLNIVEWNRYNNNNPAFKARIKGRSLDTIIDMALADGLEV